MRIHWIPGSFFFSDKPLRAVPFCVWNPSMSYRSCWSSQDFPGFPTDLPMNMTQIGNNWDGSGIQNGRFIDIGTIRHWAQVGCRSANEVTLNQRLPLFWSKKLGHIQTAEPKDVISKIHVKPRISHGFVASNLAANLWAISHPGPGQSNFGSAKDTVLAQPGPHVINEYIVQPSFW